MLNPISPHTALLVVDMQPDFFAGGPLACHDADAIVPGIDALLRSRCYRHVVATQDWHPADHQSFAAMHANRAPFDSVMLNGQAQTLWPVHGVQGTPGAALHPAIDWSAANLILRKGTDPAVDSYSAFYENQGAGDTRPDTGLGGWLHARGVREVHVVGLARDICALWTALDAAAQGFAVRFLWNLTRPVSPAGDAPARDALTRAGIAIED